MYKKLIQISYALPQLYGQIKVHKPEAPMRPVVAYFTAPTYKLSKYLSRWFLAVTGFVGTYSIKNSIDLVTKLNQTKLPVGSILVSFDVKSMYTCIPVASSIQLMISTLKQKNIPDNIIKEFQKLVTLCLANNVCIYRKKKYRFPDGLPMGGPLSPLVAEIFMTHLEETILHSHSLATHVRSWYRYVDDVLCIWRGPRSDLEVFLEHLNRFHPAISFTMDIGGEKISYLDLNIKLEEQDIVLKTSFSIYPVSYTHLTLPTIYSV